MSVFERLVDHLIAAHAKPEVRAFSRGLSLRVRFAVDDQAHDVVRRRPLRLVDDQHSVGEA